MSGEGGAAGMGGLGGDFGAGSMDPELEMVIFHKGKSYNHIGYSYLFGRREGKSQKERRRRS
jgi:hypothetical protein